MARIRTIKPEFFTDSKVLKLTPLARLFYVSLWCEADKQGRLKWDPDTLKYRYMPADKVRIADLTNELHKSGMIRLYEIDQVVYCDIPGFTKHQVINNRESESSLPAFSADACLTRESGVSDAACGKEGRKGREGKEGTAADAVSHEGDFLKFWQAYPEKVGRKDALKAWERATDKPDLQTILAALDVYKRTKPADRAWCNPATWLNQGRWNDAPAASVSNPSGIVENGEDARWPIRLEGWKRNNFWKADWGPPPDQPNCAAPKRLLESIAA